MKPDKPYTDNISREQGAANEAAYYLDVERKAFIRQFVIHNMDTAGRDGNGHLVPELCVTRAKIAWAALQSAGS